MCSKCGDPNHTWTGVQARLYRNEPAPGSDPNWRWAIHIPYGQGYANSGYGTFQSKLDAHAYMDHVNKDLRWVRDNLDPTVKEDLDYRLVEVPAPRKLTPEEICANIARALDYEYTRMELEGIEIEKLT